MTLLSISGLLCLALSSSYLPFFATSLPMPVQCRSDGCRVTNYQGLWLDRAPCNAAAAVYPTTEEELVAAVADAVRRKMKVKVISAGSHSTTKLACPGGDHGLTISTRLYDSLIHVNLTAMTVTAHAGVQLDRLLRRIAEYGLALPHTPLWDGVSVAGMVSTGAHGSGLWGKGAAAHEYIAGIRLVVPAPADQGYARVVELNEREHAAELDAARVSLGVLGAISQVTFALEPMFKRSVTLRVSDDAALGDEIERFAREHEFGSVCWYPSLNKALLKLDDRVPADTPGDGAYKLAIIHATPVSVIESIRANEESIQSSNDTQRMCELSEDLLNGRISSGDGILNDGSTFHGFPVVGFNHRMQASGGCQNAAGDRRGPGLTATGLEHDSDCSVGDAETCMWDPSVAGLFFFDTSISVPMRLAGDVIADMKKLSEASPQAMCALAFYGGVWIRFVSRSRAHLGEQEDSLVFEFFYYRSRDANAPRLHEDVMEEMEQLLLVRYGGKPHWGKNRDLAFVGMEGRTRDLPTFLLVKDRFDPEGVFSSGWSDAILGIQGGEDGEVRGVQTLTDHCALEGLCICSEDRHCAPELGYVCRKGRVLETARVCRYEGGLKNNGGENVMAW